MSRQLATIGSFLANFGTATTIIESIESDINDLHDELALGQRILSQGFSMNLTRLVVKFATLAQKVQFLS